MLVSDVVICAAYAAYENVHMQNAAAAEISFFIKLPIISSLHHKAALR